MTLSEAVELVILGVLLLISLDVYQIAKILKDSYDPLNKRFKR